MVFTMTFKIDDTKKPMTIAMVGTDDVLKDQKANGILELDGDTLKVSYTTEGDAPKDSASAHY